MKILAVALTYGGIGLTVWAWPNGILVPFGLLAYTFGVSIWFAIGRER